MNVGQDDPRLFGWYHEKILSERDTFIPPVQQIDRKSKEEAERRPRADTLVQHVRHNVVWNKSELA